MISHLKSTSTFTLPLFVHYSTYIILNILNFFLTNLNFYVSVTLNLYKVYKTNKDIIFLPSVVVADIRCMKRSVLLNVVMQQLLEKS